MKYSAPAAQIYLSPRHIPKASLLPYFPRPPQIKKTTTKKKKKKLSREQRATKNLKILRVRRGAICTSRPFSLLLLVHHGPEECENLASHPKKRNLPLLNPVAHPRSVGNTPLAGAQSGAWHPV